MSSDPYSYNKLYTGSGYEKSKLKKLLLVVGLLVIIVVIASVVHLLKPPSQQSRYIESATRAARKVTPNAKVTDIKVADGFALGTTKVPTASGQAKAGYTTVFRVNTDGSMKQIAEGSSLTSLDLLEMGIPLTTQSKITVNSLAQVKQNMASTCGYGGGNAPGYNGFNGSFDPGGWQIDGLTLDVLGRVMTDAISNKNAPVPYDKKVVCINATGQGSTADDDTYVLGVQFITGDGTITAHRLSYTIDPGFARNFTLDGQDLD